MTTTLPLRHLLLALAVVAIWGSNFVVIKVALDVMPPMLLAVLRFAFAFVPACFFLPRPPVAWLNLAEYGLFVAVGQFGLLYLAMRGEISPRMASLVIQTQVFFTLGLAVWLAGERMQVLQGLGLVLAVAGIGIIFAHTDGRTTPLGLAMVLGAAFSWACGNIVGKRAGTVNMLAYVVWSSAFAVPPLALLAWIVDGPEHIATALVNADASTWLAVLWQATANTLFGYGCWVWLLARYPAAYIVPLALLVPVFGMGAAAVLLAEPLPTWKLGAAALVLSGLAVSLLGPQLFRATRAGAGD